LPESWNNDLYSPQSDSFTSLVQTSLSGSSQGKSSIEQALEQVRNVKNLTPQEFEIFKHKIQKNSNTYLHALVADEYIYRLFKRG